jgi:hypothetical protein
MASGGVQGVYLPGTQVIERSADFCTTKNPTLAICGVVASCYYSFVFLPKDNFISGIT